MKSIEKKSTDPEKLPSVEYNELIRQFHLMWDNFPGLARLITFEHKILASNRIAEEKGFIPGMTCAAAGSPEIHRGCRLNMMFQTGEAQTDNVLPDRIRGWIPVPGYDDVCIHFAVMIPK